VAQLHGVQAVLNLPAELPPPTWYVVSWNFLASTLKSEVALYLAAASCWDGGIPRNF
jgi:hypothetical protein